MSKKALISVFDKSQLENLLKFLLTQDYEFISTGGTAKYIKSLGYAVQEVSELTNFPELLGGRVKTLHPKVLGGILARRDHELDLSELAQNQIEQIDLVVVNLYPFQQVISARHAVFAEAIENIDIGGPTLLRSAAKNFQSITVLSNPAQYEVFIEQTQKYGSQSNQMLALKEKLAIAVFQECARYDAIIAEYLKSKLLTSPIGASYLHTEHSNLSEQDLPAGITLELELTQGLRYGENPHRSRSLSL